MQLNNALALKAAEAIGRHLKRTRQLRKISVSDVAVKLNLTKSMIDNLEAGVWDAVKGQNDLTNYADFLGLSSESLWAKFEQDSQKNEALSREEAKVAAKEKGEERRAEKAKMKEKAAVKKLAKTEAKEKGAAEKAAKAEAKEKAAAEKVAKAEARKKTIAKETTKAETKAAEKLTEKTDKTPNESVRESIATLSWLKPVLLILIVLVTWFAYQQWQGQTESESLKQEIIAAISEIESITIEPRNDTQETMRMAPTPRTEAALIKSETMVEKPDDITTIITAGPIEENQETTLNLSISEIDVLAEKNKQALETEKVKTLLKSALEIVYAGNCWVNAKDDDGKTLINDVRQVGDHDILEGKLPLQVILDNAYDGASCWVKVENVTDKKSVTTEKGQFVVGGTASVVVTFDGITFDAQDFIGRDGDSRFEFKK